MKKVNFGFLRSKITRYYNTMKKAKHVLDDTPNYSKVISMLEDKFSFLSSKYGFVAKVVRKHSGIYFSEKMKNLRYVLVMVFRNLRFQCQWLSSVQVLSFFILGANCL